MSIPLSYVLPVHNAESWLKQKVEELLDDLSLQEAQFELLIIDDGSLDETAQAALHLSAMYPQITFVRRESRFGCDAALQLAIRQAKGERVVMVVDASEEPTEHQFRRIELVAKRSAPPIAAPHFSRAVNATRLSPTS